MRILLTRLPLFAGILLLQIPSVTTPPTNLTDLLLQALPNVPVYVILAYIVINMQRDHAKESERRDKHEEKITDGFLTQVKRIDIIEEDRKIVEKERNDLYARLVVSFDDNSKLIKALGERTEFLIDSDKKGGDTLANVASKVNTLYDRFSKVFPRDNTLDELFNELKKLVEETKKACEESKTAPSDVTKVQAEITLASAPETKPANITGSAAA